MNEISFSKIRNIFPENDWDVGYLSEESLLQCAYSPIKNKFHINGADFTNDIHFRGITNSIVLVRNGSTWDYSFYEEARGILTSNNINDWFDIYTNYKLAAILGGVGVRARNSLIYNYKFGFDCHICVVGFNNKLVDLPTNLRVNYNLWNRCKGCDDCSKACPVGAIHNDKDPNWIDSSKCDNFTYLGDHDTIPSVKTFWSKHVYPEIPKEVVNQLKTNFDLKNVFGKYGLPFDRNGYTFDGNVTKKDGVNITVPVCRECTSQPRCSKWNGNYPYENSISEKEVPITWTEYKK